MRGCMESTSSSWCHPFSLRLCLQLSQDGAQPSFSSLPVVRRVARCLTSTLDFNLEYVIFQRGLASEC